MAGVGGGCEKSFSLGEVSPLLSGGNSVFHPLLRARYRLRVGIRAIEEKSYDLFKHFFPDIDRSVDAVARFRPVDFTRRHLAGKISIAVAILDGEQITAQDNRHSMIWIAVPWRCLSGLKPLPPYKVILTPKQNLLLTGLLHLHPHYRKPIRAELRYLSDSRGVTLAAKRRAISLACER